MFSFSKSLAALAGLLVIVVGLATLMPFAGRGQGNSPKVAPPFAPRKFYLTQTTRDGSQALAACAGGYHMASLWEIHDPSNLHYDTTLGFTLADSGSGPPSSPLASGWIRTGSQSSATGVPGVGNCQAWTSNSSADRGTEVFLPDVWNSPGVTLVSPWFTPLPSTCDNTRRVWCVQD
jgi:hypothetical protein